MVSCERPCGEVRSVCVCVLYRASSTCSQTHCCSVTMWWRAVSLYPLTLPWERKEWSFSVWIIQHVVGVLLQLHWIWAFPQCPEYGYRYISLFSENAGAWLWVYHWSGVVINIARVVRWIYIAFCSNQIMKYTRNLGIFKINMRLSCM